MPPLAVSEPRGSDVGHPSLFSRTGQGGFRAAGTRLHSPALAPGASVVLVQVVFFRVAPPSRARGPAATAKRHSGDALEYVQGHLSLSSSVQPAPGA